MVCDTTTVVGAGTTVLVVPMVVEIVSNLVDTTTSGVIVRIDPTCVESVEYLVIVLTGGVMVTLLPTVVSTVENFVTSDCELVVVNVIFATVVFVVVTTSAD